MPDWSIEIVQKDVTSFEPKNLDAMQDDLVSWNNTTGANHQPWLLDASGKAVPDPRKGIDPTQPISDSNPLDQKTRSTYLSDLILPGASSRPAFDVFKPAGTGDTWTLSYYCAVHPQVESERGTITGNVPRYIPIGT
jgi:hypothetical protein